MLVSGESSLSGLQMTAFSVCPHVAFSLWGGRVEGEREREKETKVGREREKRERERERGNSLVSLLIRTPVLWD